MDFEIRVADMTRLRVVNLDRAALRATRPSPLPALSFVAISTIPPFLAADIKPGVISAPPMPDKILNAGFAPNFRGFALAHAMTVELSTFQSRKRPLLQSKAGVAKWQTQRT